MSIEGIHQVEMRIRCKVPPGVDVDRMMLELNKSVTIATGMYPNILKIETSPVQPEGPAGLHLS